MTDSLRGCPSGCWLMVWMVKTSDVAEGEARNGREVGGEVLRCGGDSIAQKRTRWPPVHSVMVRRGEV